MNTMPTTTYEWRDDEFIQQRSGKLCCDSEILKEERRRQKRISLLYSIALEIGNEDHEEFFQEQIKLAEARIFYLEQRMGILESQQWERQNKSLPQSLEEIANGRSLTSTINPLHLWSACVGLAHLRSGQEVPDNFLQTRAAFRDAFFGLMDILHDFSPELHHSVQKHDALLQEKALDEIPL